MSTFDVLGSTLESMPLSGITYDTSGRINGYSEGATAYTISYNTNGTINQIIGGGRTQTVTYDGNNNVTGILIS